MLCYYFFGNKVVIIATEILGLYNPIGYWHCVQKSENKMRRCFAHKKLIIKKGLLCQMIFSLHLAERQLMLCP